MAMKTPVANRESLRDGRELYMDGARIPGVTEVPAFLVPIRYAAADFEYDDPRVREWDLAERRNPITSNLHTRTWPAYICWTS